MNSGQRTQRAGCLPLIDIGPEFGSTCFHAMREGRGEMEKSTERSAMLKAAVGALVVGAAVSAPAMAAPTALQRAAEKRAELQVAAAKKEAEKKSDESLSFDPFAPKAAAPSAPAISTQTPERAEAAKRLALRQAMLRRIATFRHTMLVRLAATTADHRSPNTPPPYTSPRVGDPTQPGPNVAPGPD
jgi:hypothetical protein